MTTTHLLYNLDIGEVSSVDKGAGEGVQIMLMKRWPELGEEVVTYLKRSFDTAQREKDATSGAALPDGSFPIENTEDLGNAIKAVGRASDEAEAKAHIIARAKAIGATAQLPSEWTKRLDIDHKANDEVVITHDPETNEVTTDNQKVAKVWLERVGITKAVNALGKMYASIMGDASVTDKDGAITKAGQDFVEHIEKAAPDAFGSLSLVVKTATGEHTVDEVTKKLVDEAIAKAIAPFQADIAKRDEEIAFLKMTPEEQKFVDKYGKDPVKKSEFFKMSADDKKKAMAAAAAEEAEDPVKKENVELAKRLGILEGANALQAFTKRATDLGLAESFGVTLQKAHAGDTGAVTELEGVIKALHTQVDTAGLFSEFGKSGTGATGATATEQLTAIGKKLRADGKDGYVGKSDAQVFAKAMEDPANRELAQLALANK